MSGEQLERRYRKLLRVLPKPYREAREEELLSTLMEGAPEGRTSPDLREALSLVQLGLQARLGATADGSEASTRAGETVRLIALTGTMLLAFAGATQLALNVAIVRWNPSASWHWSHPFTLTYFGNHEQSILGYEIPAGWLAVLGFLAVGRWSAARVLAVVLFLGSVSQTGGMQTALIEETVLAGVVTAALFAVRGVHARRALVPSLGAVAVVLGVAGLTYEGNAGPVVHAIMVLQGWGFTDGRHALAMAAPAVAAVCVVGFRSAVWPVALAVVAVAALGPVLVQASVHPDLEGSDLAPVAFLAGALVVVAVLAEVKERVSA